MFQTTTYLLKTMIGSPSDLNLAKSGHYQKNLEKGLDTYGSFCRDVSSA